jgi:hypothetical protein
MKRILLGLCLLTALTAWGPIPTASAQSEVMVHFMVVPAQPKDGMERNHAMAEFREKLAELAGGYTCLEVTDGGSISAAGQYRSELNYSFIVAAEKDMTGELEKLATEFFDADKPFILVWPGRMN